MSNANLTARKSEQDREIENLWATDHALHVRAIGSTLLGEQQVAEFSPLIELDSSNGLSTVYRDTTETTNSGSVSNSNGEHKLSTGTTSGSDAKLFTKEKGRYQPGITAIPGLAMRCPTALSSDEETRWGYFDDTDGMFFGEDSTGIFVRHRHNSTDEDKVYQSNWNVDTLDGSGDQNNPSGLSINISNVEAFRMPFLWYGGGPIEMMVEILDSDNRLSNVVVHRFGPPSGEPILSNPKLPIRAEADNGTTTTDVELFVQGRHFAVIGRYNPNRRDTAEERLGVSTSTTVIPLVTFQKKSGRIHANKSVKVSNISLLSDTNSLWEVILDGSLTDSNFTSPSRIDASETAIEVDTSATAISGGTAIAKGLVAGGQGSFSDVAGISRLGTDLPEGTTVTIAIRTVSGTGTASSVFTAQEEW